MLPIARMLILIGLILIVIGGMIYLVNRAGIPLGRLPLDMRIQGQNFTCVIALGTSLLLSVVLTLILNLVIKLLNK